MARPLAWVLVALVASAGPAVAASLPFATSSSECWFYGVLQPVFACSASQEGVVSAATHDCIASGCVVRVAVHAEGDVQVPGLEGLNSEVRLGETRVLLCHRNETFPPGGHVECDGEGVLFVPVLPGACASFQVNTRIVEVLLSVVVSANYQFHAETERDVEVCRDAAGDVRLA